MRAQPRRQAVHQALPRVCGRQVVVDQQPARQQLPQQAVGLQTAGRLGARLQQARIAFAQVQALQQFLPQPCLAHARVGQHQGHADAAGGDAVGVQRGQLREFIVAPDGGRDQAFDTARHGGFGPGLHAAHEPGAQWLVVALHPQRRLGVGDEEAAHLGPRRVADPQLAHGRTLLHACSQVHGVAHRRLFGFGAIAQQHRAGVDADAHAKVRHTQVQAHALGVARGVLQDLQAGAHGAFGFVFAQALQSEHGLDAIAGEAQDFAARLAHRIGKELQRGAQQVCRVFGADTAEHGGGISDIGKEHADLAQARRGCPHSRGIHGRRSCLSAQGGNGFVNGRVPQGCTKGLQLGDGLIQRAEV